MLSVYALTLTSNAVDYPPPSSVKSSYVEPGPPTSVISSSAPNSASGSYQTMPPAAASPVAFLDEVNPDTLPPEYKREGSDWFAVFNPKLKPALDVNLLNTFNHERCDESCVLSWQPISRPSVLFVAFAFLLTASSLLLVVIV